MLGALAALLLCIPMSSYADHGNSVAGDEPFDPFVIGPEEEFADTQRLISWELSQPDHHGLPVVFDIRLPLEWQVGVANIRPGAKADFLGNITGDADTCQETMTGFGDNNLEAPATFARAETVGIVDVIGMTETTRRESSGSAPRPPEEADPEGTTSSIGSGNVGPSGAPNRPWIHWQGGIAFLGWDAEQAEARLCFYLHANDARLDREVEGSPGFYNRGAREYLFEGSIGLTDVGWNIGFDLRSIFANAFMQEEDLAITGQRIRLADFSAGNWNGCEDKPNNCRDPQTFKFIGDRAPVSRTPRTPGDYTTHHRVVSCVPTSPTAASPCEAGTERVVERSLPVRILPGATALIRHPWATLVQPAPFEVITGSDSVNVAWRQPLDAPAGDAIRGYLLVVARPGVEASRHLRYLITDPYARQEAGLPLADNPCGFDGAREECSIDLVFPLATISDDPLSGDGRYSMALITLYEDGHRSDGLCDDGTLDGVRCPLEKDNFRADPPGGVDRREFLVRSRSWPLTYQDVESHDVLFVDFAVRRAEFVRWAPGTSFERVYLGASNTILGDNGSGGSITYVGPSTLGSNALFQGFVPPGLASAVGLLVTYDPRGLPGAPNGMPEVEMVPFSGVRR